MGSERPVGDICAILRLDEEAEERLLALRQAAGAPPAPFYAHVTLAHYQGLEKAAAVDWAARCASAWRPIPLRFDGAGLLTPDCAACFLAMDAPLQDCYRAFHREYDRFCDQWTALSHGRWRPHCSLVTDTDADYFALARALERAFRPFTGRAAALELSEVLPQGFDVFASWQLEKECFV